ncbi:MAG: 2,5-diamino-6-(ribosylamino)-4(3H)-pyrimidinone 5'-phosphate reductase [Candidatus Helarchaeota archaeon]
MIDVKIPKDRPYVILNAAMSLDGKISTINGDGEFSDEVDWKRVHKLRADVDGIMVGIGTILKDDPKLRVKFYEGSPARIIVDSKLRIPLNAKAITFESQKYPRIIGTTKQAPKEKIDALKKLGVKIFVCGSGPLVDLVDFMKKLRNNGIQTIMLEGGGTLNFSMFKQNLIDEVRISMAPVIIGGEHAVSLVEGNGFSKVAESVDLKLKKMQQLGKNILLIYKVNNHKKI